MGLPDPLSIERAGLKAWPGIEVEWDGAWVRRASNGLTQRANSTQCFDPGDDENATQRLAAARRWFEARNLKPTFRVTPLTGPALKDALDGEGWIAIDHSRVMAMELGPTEPDPRGEVLAVDDPAFLEAQRRLKPYDEATLQKFRAILDVFEVPARGLDEQRVGRLCRERMHHRVDEDEPCAVDERVLRAADGRAVSSALMAVADGIVITGNVVTDPGERRKGRAAAMMRTGLAWAIEAGANAAALNVAADNRPALALYERLGYRPQYDYVYRVPGAA